MEDLKLHGLIGKSGLPDFYGDGSDGTFNLSINLTTATTAPNSGTVSQLYDMNASTIFTTSSLGAGADNVAFTIDIGTPQLLKNIKFWQTRAGTTRSYQIQSSTDGTSWTQRATVSITNTATDFEVSISNITARYWRISTLAGTAGAFFSQGITINSEVGDLQTTKVFNIFIPSTLNGSFVKKQYDSFDLTLGTGYALTTSNPCQGLVIYSKGNVNINGAISMTRKATVANNGSIVPMVITKKNSLSTKTLEKYFQLTDVLEALKGGNGGNGGYGGGYSGSTGRKTTVGTGGLGRQNLGGFGAGGNGGALSGGNTGIGIGGSIPFSEIGYGRTNGVSKIQSTNGISSGINGENGAGATGDWTTTGVTGTSSTGRCYGGGTGGTGSMANTTAESSTDSEYAGGFILIICGGDFANSSTISANGGNGSNGTNASTGATAGGGGGGGGGAGGGVIAILYKGTYTNTGTLQANGGTGGVGGTGLNGGESGGTGTSGSTGTILTQQI